MMTFGDRLRTARKDQGLTQKELADRVGVGQTTVANYEQGTRFPDGTVLVSLADSLSTSIDYLLGRDGIDSGDTSGRSVRLDWVQLQDEYLSLVRNGKKKAGLDLVLDAVATGARLKDLLELLLRPVLETVGELWESGEIGIETEHYASYAVEELLATVQSRMEPMPPNGKTAIAVVAPGEQHSLGLRMATNLLEAHGWECRFLGLNVPVQSLKEAIRERNPDLLMISVTMDFNLDAAAMMIETVRSRFDVPILLGGRILDRSGEEEKNYGADATAVSSIDALEKAQVLTSPVLRSGRSER